ncbi:MAG: hypothetical protein HUU37_00515 [Bdellovibrionales bacterium]|nr:hypothetical protein [Bdellovibrionales bacterium]
MIIDAPLLFRVQLTAAVLLVAVGFVCATTRRAAFWTTLGSILCFKGVMLAASAWLMFDGGDRQTNLVKLMILSTVFLFVGISGGVAVSLAAKRSAGSLDLERETSLRR